MKTIHPVFFFLFVFCSCEIAIAQEYKQINFPFKVNGQTLRNPLTGGLNAAQLSEVDLNNDGIMDLFVFDKHGNVELTFINGGAAGVTDYDYVPEYQKYFPDLKEWVALRDYNADGAMDIFTQTQDPAQGIDVHTGYFENDTLKFVRKRFPELIYDIIPFPTGNNTFAQVYVTGQDYPSIDDIDGDGDLDILTFAQNGGYIYLFSNQSVEMGFGTDSLEYDLTDDCWGGVYELGLTPCLNLPTGPDDCAEPENENSIEEEITDSRNGGLHAGSTLLTFDDNNDGDKECILGDLNFPNLIYLHNAGTNDDSYVDMQDCNYPEYDVPALVQTFPTAFYLDLNNDDRKDLVSCPNITNGVDFENLWFYKNTTSNDNPVFGFESKEILSDEMLDFGTGANPVFVDYNQDGLLDLVVGNRSKYILPSLRPSQLSLFINVGTAEAPVFELLEEDWLGMSDFASSALDDFAPTFGDLDSDGDEDLIVGTNQGKLFYFENNAGPGATLSFGFPVFNYMDIDIANNSTPQIIDVDRDGLKDLLIGEQSVNSLDPDDPTTNGNFNFFKNNGTSTEPFFFANQDTMGNNKALGFASTIDPGANFGYSAPVMIDFDGEYRLFSGSNLGRIKLFENIDGNLDGRFEETGVSLGGIDQGEITRVALADIDNDNLYEMLVGNARGGLAFYQTPFFLDGTVEVKELVGQSSKLNIYPNPASTQFTVAFEAVLSDPATIEIYDVRGRLVKRLQTQQSTVEIDVQDWPKGLYVCRVETENQFHTKKMLVQ